MTDQLKRLEVAQRTLSDSGLELQHVSATAAGEHACSSLPAGLLALTCLSYGLLSPWAQAQWDSSTMSPLQIP